MCGLYRNMHSFFALGIIGTLTSKDTGDPAVNAEMEVRSLTGVGRAALERRRANPHRKLVGLEFGGNETINHGDCVYAGRAQVELALEPVRGVEVEAALGLEPALALGQGGAGAGLVAGLQLLAATIGFQRLAVEVIDAGAFDFGGPRRLGGFAADAGKAVRELAALRLEEVQQFGPTGTDRSPRYQPS